MAPSLERILKSVWKAGSRGSLSGFKQKYVDDYDDVPRYPPFAKGFPVVAPERLLADQQELVSKIERALGMTDKDFERLVKPTLLKFAEYVHLLPASEHHHHRGAGGLLRHSLEVAFFATRSSEGVIFEQDKTPGGITQGEPRWRLAAFLSGLLHDSGKPITDLSVVDKDGRHEWDIFTKKTLYEWAKENRIDRYFLRWERSRHKRHERMATYAIGKLLSDEVIAYLRVGGKEINQALMDAVTGLSVSTPLSRLMLRADSASVEMDLREQYIDRVDKNAVGVAVERYLVSAMRALIAARDWKANEPGSLVWVGEDAAYVNWRKAAQDVTRQLQKDNVPGIPQSPDTLAEILLDRGLAIGQPVESERPGSREQVDPETGEVVTEEPEHVLPYWYVRIDNVQTAIGVGKASFMALKLPIDILYSTDMPPKPHDDIEVVTDAQRRQEKAAKEEDKDESSERHDDATSNTSKTANDSDTTVSAETTGAPAEPVPGEESQPSAGEADSTPLSASDDGGTKAKGGHTAARDDAEGNVSASKERGEQKSYAMGAPGLRIGDDLNAMKMRSLADKRPSGKASKDKPVPPNPHVESHEASEGSSITEPTLSPGALTESPQSAHSDSGVTPEPEAETDPYAGVMNLDDMFSAFSASPPGEAVPETNGVSAASDEKVAQPTSDQITEGQESVAESASSSSDRFEGSAPASSTPEEKEAVTAEALKSGALGCESGALAEKPRGSALDSSKPAGADEAIGCVELEAPASPTNDDATEKTERESEGTESLITHDQKVPESPPSCEQASAMSEKANPPSGKSDKTDDVFTPLLAKSSAGESKSRLRSGAVMSGAAQVSRQGKTGILPLGDDSLAVAPRKASVSALSGLDTGLATAGVKAQQPLKQGVRSMPLSSAPVSLPQEPPRQTPKDRRVSVTAEVGKQAGASVLSQYKQRLASQPIEALAQAAYVERDNVFIRPKRIAPLLSIPAHEVVSRLKEIDAVDVRIEKHIPRKVVLFGALAAWLRTHLPSDTVPDESTRQVRHTLKKQKPQENAAPQPPPDKVTSLIASSESVREASTPSDDVADIGAEAPVSERADRNSEKKQRVLELLDMVAMDVVKGEGPWMLGVRRKEADGWSIDSFFTHDLVKSNPDVSIGAIRRLGSLLERCQSKRDPRYSFYLFKGRFYVVSADSHSKSKQHSERGVV